MDIQKNQQLPEEESLEQETPDLEESSQNGFPEDVDFRKVLGCGGWLLLPNKNTFYPTADVS